MMLKFATLALAASALAATAGAQMTATHATTKTSTVKPTPMPTMTTMNRMATHTTAKGKKITYDCSKKGNATKKVCKK